MSAPSSGALVLRRHAASLVAVSTGAVMVRLVLTGAHTAYVRPSTGWLLLAGGTVLLVAGGAGLVPRTDRPSEPGEIAVEGGHVHAAPRSALLLVLPLALLVLIAPPSLGAFYAQHARTSARVEALPADRAPLPATTGAALPLSLGQIERRAAGGSTLAGVVVRATGFSAGRTDDGRVLLTRFSVRCCAADAVPAQVALLVPPDLPVHDGDWFNVVATWDGAASGALLSAVSVIPVQEPDDPYEV